MGTGHVVWDWNGTLLDDQHLVVRAANASLAPLGVGALTDEEYRDHYTRPVHLAYESILGRPVTEAEWELINQTFHDTYYELASAADLAADAVAAIELLDEAGWTQSVLSMSPHDRLSVAVAQRGITERFVAVDGVPSPTGAGKVQYLRTHLARHGFAAATVTKVGDTPDDAAAAAAVGARAVLYDGGSHHRSALEAAGVPVVASLLEAARAIVED